MKKLILLLTAVFAVLVIMLLSSIGQAQSADPSPTPTSNRDWRTTATAETIQQPAAATPTRFFTLSIAAIGVPPTTETTQRPAAATPTATPGPGGPTEPGGPTGPIHTGGESIPAVDATADPNATPTPTSGPGDPTGPVHTGGEGIFDIDAAATALHQMIHSPDAPRAFRSICDLPPRSPADVVACEAYKAAYRLRHGNPCRHNDEGEAVCLH